MQNYNDKQFCILHSTFIIRQMMNNQRLTQTQRQELKLSPQQIQLMKLLQLPLIELEQRIKEEMEINPALEDTRENDYEDNEPTVDEPDDDNGENDDYNDDEEDM